MKKIENIESLVKGNIYKFIYRYGSWFIQKYLYKYKNVYHVLVIDSSYKGSISKHMTVRNCSDIYEMTTDEVIMEVYL